MRGATGFGQTRPEGQQYLPKAGAQGRFLRGFREQMSLDGLNDGLPERAMAPHGGGSSPYCQAAGIPRVKLMPIHSPGRGPARPTKRNLNPRRRVHPLPAANILLIKTGAKPHISYRKVSRTPSPQLVPSDSWRSPPSTAHGFP